MSVFETYADQIADCTFFKGLSKAEIMAILPCLSASLHTYHKEEIIWLEGSRTTSFGIVVTGAITISGSDVWGRSVVLGHGTQGQSFGEAYAALPETPLLSHVIAQEETTVLFINCEKVLTTCGKNCQTHAILRRRLVQSLAQRNIDFAQHLQDGAPHSIRAKLLAFLSTAAKKAQSPEFDIHYTRQQLADYLGVDRTSLCSVMATLQKEGVITTKRKHFVLHNTQAFDTEKVRG